MSAKENVIDYLQEQPKFRERSNKDRGIVNLLMRKYAGVDRAVQDGLITKEALIAFVQDYATMDRAWRQALEKTPALRGSDYEEKEELENKKMVELGYRLPQMQL